MLLKYQHLLFSWQTRRSTDGKLKIVSSRNQTTSSAHQMQFRNDDPGQFLQPLQMDEHPEEELQLRMAFLASCGCEVCAGGSPAPKAMDSQLGRPRVTALPLPGKPCSLCWAGPLSETSPPVWENHLSLSAPLYQYLIIL